ncbi:hypothetical protein D3C72_673250 [compost metagenome]
MRMQPFPMWVWAPNEPTGDDIGGVNGGVDRNLGPGDKQAGIPRSYQQGATSQATQQDYDVAEDANTVRPAKDTE